MNTEMDITTAIKAIWLLYRRGKWPLLESIGISRERYEALFVVFDEQYITSYSGTLRQEGHVQAFLRCMGPHIVDRAVFLLRMYWLVSEIEREVQEHDKQP